MNSPEPIGTFLGEPISQMPREKLLGVIAFLSAKIQTLDTEINRKAIALGKVEMMKRGEYPK